METQEEKFKVGISVMGNEVLGFSLESSSARKNWVFVGFLFMIGMSVFANNMLPVIDYVSTISAE